MKITIDPRAAAAHLADTVGFTYYAGGADRLVALVQKWAKKLGHCLPVEKLGEPAGRKVLIPVREGGFYCRERDETGQRHTPILGMVHVIIHQVSENEWTIVAVKVWTTPRGRRSMVNQPNGSSIRPYANSFVP